MKLRGYVIFGVRKCESEALRAFARNLGCEDAVSETVWTDPIFKRRFYDDDPRLAVIRDWLAGRGDKYSVTWEPEYSLSELRAAQLLRLIIRRAPIDGCDASDGTKYDDSVGCSACGTGALQTGPALIRPSDLPKRRLLCETHRGHVLSREPLAIVLRDARVSGVELRQVASKRGGDPLGWWQWVLLHTLPRMSQHSRGIVRDTSPGWGCPVCRRDMHAHDMGVPTQIAYDGSQVRVEELPDIMATWECFGRSVLNPDPERHLVRGFAQPLVIVKPRVMELLRSLKVREAYFEPVRIVPD